MINVLNALTRIKKYRNEPVDLVRKKANFIKSIFSTIGVMVLLIFINKATSPFHFWARIPILIMMGVLALRALQFLGHMLSQRIEERHAHNQKPYTEDPLPYTQDDKLELKDIHQPMKTPQKAWKDSDLV